MISRYNRILKLNALLLLHHLVKCIVREYVFYVFLKIQKNVTFYVFCFASHVFSNYGEMHVLTPENYGRSLHRNVDGGRSLRVLGKRGKRIMHPMRKSCGKTYHFLTKFLSLRSFLTAFYHPVRNILQAAATIRNFTIYQYRTKPMQLHKFTFFTRDSIYAVARICHLPSVCPYVTRVDQSKTVEVRITQSQFSPCSSPIPLVFVFVG